MKLNRKTSLWSTIVKGVPQGSILGPLLFNIFLNDLFLIIEKAMLANYADDNSMHQSHKDPSIAKSELLSDVQNAISWFRKNYMSVNPENCPCKI